MERQIYIALLEEGTRVWRPVQAFELGQNVFRISGEVPIDEVWQFQPGETVRCVEQQLDGVSCLVAVAPGAVGA